MPSAELTSIRHYFGFTLFVSSIPHKQPLPSKDGKAEDDKHQLKTAIQTRKETLQSHRPRIPVVSITPSVLLHSSVCK